MQRRKDEILYDWIVIDELTASPPQNWNRILLRWRILAPHICRNNLTRREVDRIAEAAQISRRQVYADLRKYRHYVSGDPVKGPMTGVHYHICQRQEQVIAEVIENMSGGAKLHEVIKEIGRICARRQVNIPSATAIGTRFGKVSAAVNLKGRLITRCDAVLDICGLPIESRDHDGNVRSLHLLTILDTLDGAVLNYRLSVGFPPPREVQNLIAAYAKESPSSIRLLLTKAFADSVEILSAGIPAGVVLDYSRNIRAGRAIKAALGSRLGRIKLRIDQKTWAHGSELPPVDFSMADAVIRRLSNPKTGLNSTNSISGPS